MTPIGVACKIVVHGSRFRVTPRGVVLRLRACVMLGVLGYASVGAAQTRGPSVCVPRTTVCASADGRGGVQINANGSGHISPTGLNANANANANGQETDPPPPQYSGGGGAHSRGYRGRFGVGVALCPVARQGVWSGFKAGGCVAVSFRFEGLTFEMESQLLYGGSTHAFDWTFPMSFIIPLANEDSLFDGGYLRFGGSPVGVTFAHKKDGGSFMRFGLYAGAGYELALSDAFSWRVIDARLSFDMGTRRAMDDRGHWVDLGLQLGSGLVF